MWICCHFSLDDVAASSVWEIFLLFLWSKCGRDCNLVILTGASIHASLWSSCQYGNVCCFVMQKGACAQSVLSNVLSITGELIFFSYVVPEMFYRPILLFRSIPKECRCLSTWMFSLWDKNRSLVSMAVYKESWSVPPQNIIKSTAKAFQMIDKL